MICIESLEPFGLFGKDFFTTGNFAFGGRSLIGTRGDLTNALEGAVYNKDAPQMPKRKPYKKTKKYDKNFHKKLLMFIQQFFRHLKGVMESKILLRMVQKLQELLFIL